MKYELKEPWDLDSYTDDQIIEMYNLHANYCALQEGKHCACVQMIKELQERMPSKLN